MLPETARAQAATLSLNYLEYVVGEGDGFLFTETEGVMPAGGGEMSLKIGGENLADGQLSSGEADLRYSQPISRATAVFAGARQGFAGGENTYALAGMTFAISDSLTFELESALSDQGHLYGKLEVSGVIERGPVWVEPKAELYMAAQDVPLSGTGSGFDAMVLALRGGITTTAGLRPYVGIMHERLLGGSAEYARISGEGVRAYRVMIGLRYAFTVR